MLIDFMHIYFPSQQALPINDRQMALFVTYMFNKRLASSTINTYVAAAGTCHRLAQLRNPGVSFIVKKLVTATQKGKSAKDSRLPITKFILDSLLTKLPLVCREGLSYITFRAMFLLAFYAFLRIGEITVRNASVDPTKLIQTQDVVLLADPNGNLKALQLCINNWKSQIPGVPFSLTVLAQPGKFCPVLALKNYLRMRGTLPVPLFLNSDKSPVTRSKFGKVLKDVAQLAGFDQKRIKSHSFRIGAATTAAGLGFSEDQIKRMGRWRSEAVQKYIRITSFVV